MGAPRVNVVCGTCGKQYTKSKYDVAKWSGDCHKCTMRGMKTTHGLSRTKLYRTWQQMVQRTTNPYNKATKQNYIDKNITVCNEWINSPEVFILWANENGYNDGLTIDRIDNDDNYTPANCRWVNRSIQAQNRGKLGKNNTYTGVETTKEGNFKSTVYASGKYVFRKTFKTETEAVQARNEFIISNNLNHIIQEITL